MIPSTCSTAAKPQLALIFDSVDFRKGYWGPTSLEIHSTPQGAFDADQSAEFRSFLTSNPAQSRGTAPEAFASLRAPRAFYSFYQARSGTNSYTLPTRFNADSAPQVLELVKGAIEKKIAQVETELAALKTSIVWQGAGRLVFTVATAALQRLSVPPKLRTLRETVGPQVKAPAPPLRTARPFLTAEKIKEMLARGVKVFTHRTFKLDVVQKSAHHVAG